MMLDLAIPSMLPFTAEQFFDVFERYNEAVWPMQLLLQAISIAILWLLLRGRPGDNGTIAGLLAVLWVWAAVGYAFAFLTDITPLGWIVGALLLGGAACLAWAGIIEGRLQFGYREDWRGLAGNLLIFYAVFAYPLLGHIVGQDYPAIPTFGLPAPVVILSVGLLLLASPASPRSVFLAPALLGVLMGGASALFLGVYQDIGLIAAGVLSAVGMAAGAPLGKPSVAGT